jgi:hypothetical protein
VVHRGVVDRIRRAFESLLSAIGKPVHSLEVSVKRRGLWQVWKRCFRKIKRAMQEATRAGRIDDETGLKLLAPGTSQALQFDVLSAKRWSIEFQFVHVGHTNIRSGLREVVVEFRTIPVRVRDFVFRARANQQLVIPICVV